MVKHDSLPRNCWQLARVSQANISNDGHVRTVQVTVGDPSLSAKGKRNRPVRLLDRPIHKLILLLPRDYSILLLIARAFVNVESYAKHFRPMIFLCFRLSMILY